MFIHYNTQTYILQILSYGSGKIKMTKLGHNKHQIVYTKRYTKNMGNSTWDFLRINRNDVLTDNIIY